MFKRDKPIQTTISILIFHTVIKIEFYVFICECADRCYSDFRKEQKERRFLLLYPRRELNLKFPECYSTSFFCVGFRYITFV